MDGAGAGITFPVPLAPEPGEAIEIAEGILWLRMPLPMALDHVNLYALDDGDGWTIVDTGLDSAKLRAIWRSVLAAQLGRRPITRVIVTHHHPDHVGLAGWFRSAHGADLWFSRTAFLTARMLTLDVQDRPAEDAVAFWRGAGMDEEVRIRRMSERPFNFADVVARLPIGFTRIVEGQTIATGGRSWIVRMGNGHAPEHVTLWSTDGEIVLGGDQLLPGISPNLSVYPTEPEADPVNDWMQSCVRLAPFATDEQLVLPGHKLPYRGLPQRLTELVENHHGALMRLEAHLTIPHTAAECFGALFRRRIGPSEYGLALGEALAHCLYLVHRGRATRSLREDGAWLFRTTGR